MAKLGGADISNEVFAQFWNDASKNNREVATAIFSHYNNSDVSWEPIRGKLRSKTLKELLSVERTGGISGNVVGASSTAAPASGSTMAAPPPEQVSEAAEPKKPAASSKKKGKFTVNFRFGSSGDFVAYSSSKASLDAQQQEVAEQMMKHNLFKNGFSNIQMKAYSDSSLGGRSTALTQPDQFQDGQYVTVTKVIKAG